MLVLCHINGGSVPIKILTLDPLQDGINLSIKVPKGVIIRKSTVLASVPSSP